jgi:hypothetical protein
MMAEEPILVTERERTDSRMEPIGPDDEVEGPWRAVLELDRNRITAIFEGDHSIAEAVVGRVARALVQDAAEIAAEDLDVTGRHDFRNGGAGLAVQSKKHKFARSRPAFVDCVPDAHALEDGTVDGTAKVDCLTAGAQGGPALDNRARNSTAIEPHGKRLAGYAGARDEDVETLHDGFSEKDLTYNVR